MSNIKIKKVAIREFLVYSTIISAFFGPAFFTINLGPFSLFPFRIVLIVLCFYFLLNMFGNNRTYNLKEIRVKNYLFFYITWIIWATFQLLWAKSIEDALIEYVFLSMGIILILFMVLYLKTINSIFITYRLWLIVFLFTLVIGIWEIQTGNHLQVSGLLGEADRFRFAPTAIFRNQNDFASFLSISSFFLIASIRYSENKFYKFLLILVFCILIILLMKTNSRANYIALLLGLSFLFLFLFNLNKKLKVFVAGIISIPLSLLIFQSKLVTIAEGIYSEILSVFNSDGDDASINVRMNLIKNSLLFLKDTAGFGIGPGNVEHYMRTNQFFSTQGIENVHNWWIEILINYGIFIFVGYVIVYVSLIYRLYRIFFKIESKNERMICEALLCSLLSFSISSISPSSVMTLYYQWVLFGLSFSFLNYIRKKVV